MSLQKLHFFIADEKLNLKKKTTTYLEHFYSVANTRSIAAHGKTSGWVLGTHLLKLNVMTEPWCKLAL